MSGFPEVLPTCATLTRNALEMFVFGNQALTKILNSNRREGRERVE